MKTSHTIAGCAALLAALALPALAQADNQSEKQAELNRAATGDSFRIGDTRFRLAPGARVSAAGADADPTRELIVADHVIDAAPPATAARNRRSLDADADAGDGAALAAAVSDGGVPVVVAPELNVYFSQADTLDRAVRETGGRLVYSTEVGGKGTIAYDSVEQAMAAMQRIQGLAGVSEVAPRLVQDRDIGK